MTLALVPLLPLAPAQLSVMRIRAVRTALLLLSAAAAAEFLIPDLPMRGVVIGPTLLLALWIAVFAPQRRWRRWGYAFTGEELHVTHGLWTQVHTIVPVLRVQHIDISQGILERVFGVATLVLHTAGTVTNVVVLPGISRGTAEEIRDAIRNRIGATGDA